MDETTRAAFERLLAIAGRDTGQARRVADFVLAWWNAKDLGGFNLFDLFSLDVAICRDMETIFVYLARREEGIYPEEYRPQIEAVIRQWRPDVWAKATAAA